MAEQFANTAQTTLNGAIDNSTTSVVVTSASAFPTAGNFRILIDSELLLVTSVSSNTFTVATRGTIEGTSAASHSNGATVTHVLTAASVRQAIQVPNLLESVKVTADTPDDDFPGTSLDGKWTVVDGSAGSVSLLGGSGAGVYEVGERNGWLSMMVGTASGDSVVLRQDYTLPDGNCIVAPVAFAIDQEASVGNNEILVGIGLNDNDAGPYAATTGQTILMAIDTQAAAYRALALEGSGDPLGTQGSSGDSDQTPGVGLWFLRIDRVGLAYHCFWSRDGFSWGYVGAKTMSTAANNLWLFANCEATMANRMVVGVPWFRQGTALAIDPWPL